MLLIGERINSSSRRISLAINKRDVALIQSEARAQVEAGADMVDVNVGALTDNEPEHLRWLVQVVQQVVDVPLSLDTTNPAAMEAALAVHKGRALLNSVTAQEDRLQGMLPLVKKFRCGVVALCVDDQGVPESAEGKFRVASGLVRRLLDAGVPSQDIYIDPAVTPIAVSSCGAREVLEAVDRVHKSFSGVHVIAGLSNVSFGLPVRRLLNQVFLIMAMTKGLDAVIMDLLDSQAMSNLHTARALLGDDRNCQDFMQAYRQGKLLP